MDGITLNVYGLDGADEFASAASYAQVRCGLGNGKASLERNHMYSLDGAVLGAGSAAGAVHVHYADILVEYYAAGLSALLLFNCKRFDGTGRAHLAAYGAAVVAVAVIKLHYRLHHAAQSIFQASRLEYMAGAFAYAKMAGGAVLQQIPVADGSGRRHRYTLIFLTRNLGLKSGRSKSGNCQC